MMQKKNPVLLSLAYDAQYEVQQILSRKNTKNGLKYLVKWKGFEIDQCTWEPLNHLYNSMEVVQSYQRKLMERRDAKESESLLQKNNKQNILNQKEQSFQENLIFPRLRDIKFQSKKQSVEDQNKKKKKRITKKHNNHKKALKRKAKETKGSQIYILIDEDQSRGQIEKPTIREQRNKEQECEQKQKQEKKIENLLQSSQFKIESEQQKEINMLNDIDDQYELMPSFSLHLTQMQQQEGNRLKLQNLNPNFYQQFTREKQYDRRKICRLTSAESIKILQAKDPILKNKELRINKIVNLEGKWLVEIKLRETSHGFAYFETLKKINLMKVLDFLVELIPKQ